MHCAVLCAKPAHWFPTKYGGPQPTRQLARTENTRAVGWLSAICCEELQVSPAHRKRSSKVDDATNRENCRNEYRSLMQVLGFRPDSGDLRRHTDGLYKRMMRSWPSFEAFCDDIGVAPPRRYAAGSRAGRRPRAERKQLARSPAVAPEGHRKMKGQPRPN